MSEHKNVIKKTAFTIKPSKHLDQYAVKILFFDHKKHKIPQSTHFLWQKKWKITPAKAGSLADGGVVHDIYSFNGVIDATRHVKGVGFWQSYDFSSDLQSLQHIAQYIPLQKQAQVVFVLDLKCVKNDLKGYFDARLIHEYEQAFVTFINHNPANLFVQQLLAMGLQYVFFEGGIKATLINSAFFSEEEKQFFQADAEGCKDFCQIAEFIINAFKRGEQVTLKHPKTLETLTLSPNDYLVKIHPDIPEFKPTQNTITFYPACYKEIATKGRYTQAMQAATGLFRCNTHVMPDDVVVMHTNGAGYGS